MPHREPTVTIFIAYAPYLTSIMLKNTSIEYHLLITEYEVIKFLMMIIDIKYIMINAICSVYVAEYSEYSDL